MDLIDAGSRGKCIRRQIRMGRYTLPIIYALRTSKNRTIGKLDETEIFDAIVSSDALIRSLTKAKTYVEMAGPD